MARLLLATNNQGKVREYRSLLREIPFQIVTLAEQGITTVVEEVGNSLEENAGLKATAMAEATATANEGRLLTLADDSGLEVDALGGEPGPLSARYAGEDASDEERVSYLLSRLKEVPWLERTARFRCVIALASRGGEVRLCHGQCDGLIALGPRGENGFGYDPVFFLPEQDMTMAALPLETKNRVSHRGQAAREACRVLAGWADAQRTSGVESES